MKTILVVFFVLITSAQASVPELPRIFFSYSWLYDSVVCEQTPPDQKWINEIEDKTGEFSDLWSKRGSELFKVLFDHTGLGFRRKEMTGTFSVCPKKPSYSDPLVINMTRYLDSYMAPMAAAGDDQFIDLIFHEVLHTWVVEHLKYSALRRKYKDEAPSVRSHLHLMAIQRFVYSNLGRDDLIKMVDETYARIGGTYARAWEIVRTEGHEAFMNEFPRAQ